MSWKLLKTRVMPVGIDLGTDTIKMAQLRRVAGELELVAADSVEVPGDCRGDRRQKLAFLADRLPQLLGGRGFRGRRCVLSVPAAETFVQHVKIAKTPGGKLDQALRLELEGKLPFSPADAIVRHVIAGETRQDQQPGLEVIVLAASREVVESYLAMARKTRMDLVALDVEPCAILECFGRLLRRSEDGEHGTLFLDLGAGCTQVVISHGTSMVFARNVMVGASNFDKAASDALGVPAERIRAARRHLAESDDASAHADRLYDAMAAPLHQMHDEITRCLRYYESVFPTHPVRRAIFLGGQALDRRLCQRIAQRLNLPAQIGDPLARIRLADQGGSDRGINRRQPQPAWAVAVGLSLGAAVPRAA